MSARTRRAFSAVETLVAIALLLLLSGALSAFLFDVHSQRERLSSLADERLAGALIIDALEDAARTAVAQGEGVAGGATSLTIAHRRAALDDPEPSPAALAGARALTLAWDETTGVLKMNGEPVTSRIERLSLRYHDDDGWVESFDSTSAGRLPAAIEIALWFGDVEQPEDPTGDTLAPDDADFGEGFGLPTPDDLASLEGPRDWREPDRLRIVPVTRLRHQEASP